MALIVSCCADWSPTGGGAKGRGTPTALLGGREGGRLYQTRQQTHTPAQGQGGVLDGRFFSKKPSPEHTRAMTRELGPEKYSSVGRGRERLTEPSVKWVSDGTSGHGVDGEGCYASCAGLRGRVSSRHSARPAQHLTPPESRGVSVENPLLPGVTTQRAHVTRRGQTRQSSNPTASKGLPRATHAMNLGIPENALESARGCATRSSRVDRQCFHPFARQDRSDGSRVVARSWQTSKRRTVTPTRRYTLRFCFRLRGSDSGWATTQGILLLKRLCCRETALGTAQGQGSTKRHPPRTLACRFCPRWTSRGSGTRLPMVTSPNTS